MSDPSRTAIFTVPKKTTAAFSAPHANSLVLHTIIAVYYI